MKYFLGLTAVLAVAVIAVTLAEPQSPDPNHTAPSPRLNGFGDGTGRLIQAEGMTVADRIAPPDGYERVPVRPGSFGEFLRNQPLKPHGARVRYYDGTEKNPAGVYIAVIDRPIRPKDLEQCADAIMRLRAEYLFWNKRYAAIAFNFARDGRPRRYLDFAGVDRSYEKFLDYLDFVFTSANTVSLYNQLKPVPNLEAIASGDIFIQKSRAINHAVIVIDMAVDKKSGEKIFLLAQSYMPAQETQILLNPNDNRLSPWYSARFGNVLETPEWRFYPAQDLRRF